MSKKTKVLICLTLVLVVIGLVFGTITIYRFIKIQKILSRVEENVAKNNFYMETTIINKGTTKKTQTYYRDGVGKFVSVDGTYTWFDGEKAYIVDEENELIKNIPEDENIAIITEKSFASLYPCFNNNFFGRLMFAGNLNNKIKTQGYNGKKCTVIEVNENEYTKYFWITKDLSELVYAKVEFSNGDIYEYKYDIKFHSTKLKDIELPDFSKYTTVEDSNEDAETTEEN